MIPDYLETQESNTINIDAPQKDGEHVPMVHKKRKRAGFMEEELTIFNIITQTVKEVAITIRESKTVDFHPEPYDTVMEQGGFSPEALMVALSHMLDKKA
ncbi:Histone-lysine N-methyltransferase SUVR5 [Hordeum vulgare]|nr:Histone-lysine N-methyltransferase SUVR5 [Hordeum vulgare]